MAGTKQNSARSKLLPPEVEAPASSKVVLQIRHGQAGPARAQPARPLLALLDLARRHDERLGAIHTAHLVFCRSRAFGLKATTRAVDGGLAHVREL